MSTGVATLTINDRVSRVLNHYLLPIGWLVIMTGMFWAWERSLYHKFFYLFLAAPTLVALAMQPALLRRLLVNPLFAAFLAFSVYMMISVAWAEPESDFGSLIKRPLYIAMLLFAAGIIALKTPERMAQLTRVAGMIAALAAAVSVVYFIVNAEPGNMGRLEGYGALYNPLLSGHVYGAFAAFWMGTWFLSRSPFSPLPLLCLAALGLLLIATGSRTPLVGLAAAFAWLLIVCDKKRGLLALGVIVAMLAGLVALHPEIVTQRGVSYRPEIWAESLRQISLKPWLGYGYDTPMVVMLASLPDYPLFDPHNIELGVLYAGGIVGLTLWLVLYGLAMTFCWKNRRDPAVVLAAAWLIFGFASGLTEGNAFMSRPKEHWFLIWLPMAMVYAQWLIHWQGWALKKSQ